VRGIGGSFGLGYLDECQTSGFWNGTVYGLHSAVLVVGTNTYAGTVAICGRSRRRKAESVTLAGTVLFPLFAASALNVQTSPGPGGGARSGRIVGHAVAAGMPPAVSVSTTRAAARLVAPLDDQALVLGEGTVVAPGLGELISDGVPVYQSRFDAAVPEAVAEGQVVLVAENSSGERLTVRRPVELPEPRPPSAFDMSLHVLEIRPDSSLWAWGDNTFGEVGDGTTSSPTGPIRLPIPEAVVSVAAGDSFSVAVDTSGAVWRWGSWEIESEVAPGEFTFKDLSTRFPVRVEGMRGIVAASAGEDHILALDHWGRVWALGENDEGQLGDGTRKGRARVPARVMGIPRVMAGAAGSEFSMALDDAGQVWAWGRSFLGNALDPGVPTLVGGLPRIREISARGMSMALADDGSVWTWGRNVDGRLGDGTRIDRDAPVQVVSLAGVTAIDAGDFHCIALRWSCPALVDSQAVGTGASCRAVLSYSRGDL